MIAALSSAANTFWTVFLALPFIGLGLWILSGIAGWLKHEYQFGRWSGTALTPWGRAELDRAAKIADIHRDAMRRSEFLDREASWAADEMARAYDRAKRQLG